MSPKILNKLNLIELGPNKLAELLLEVSKGNADIKRRLRFELSFRIGPAELGKEIRKRLVAIQKSKSYAGWRKRKALVKDLQIQVDMICDKIAIDHPTLALELLWDFIALAPSVYNRVDDSRGEVLAVFGAALKQLSAIAPLAVVDPETLALQVWQALQDNLYGECDGIIPLLAPTLGYEGLLSLKQFVIAYQNNSQAEEEDHAALVFLRSLRGKGSQPNSQKMRLVKAWLQDIALAQGDVDAYVALYSEQDLLQPDVAAKIAKMWLDLERHDEARALLEAVDLDAWPEGIDAWDIVYVRCLSEMGNTENVQLHWWQRFEQSLSAVHLRKYLKLLPDFEDIEVEDSAKMYALKFSNFDTALTFFLEWPDFILAARLIKTRSKEITGSFDWQLTSAVDALRERHPLEAVILLRIIITNTLDHQIVSRYADAAMCLRDCVTLDAKIDNYDEIQTHVEFRDGLEMQHERQGAFWNKLNS